MTKLVGTAVLLLALAGGAFAYIQTEPDWYVRLRYPLSYQEIVAGHAKNYDLDPALLAAVIYRESKFDAQAHSDSGAIGLMRVCSVGRAEAGIVGVSDVDRMVSSSRSYSSRLTVCGTPSSVTRKSSAVRPSIGRPLGSVTVTVTTRSDVPPRNVMGG